MPPPWPPASPARGPRTGRRDGDSTAARQAPGRAASPRRTKDGPAACRRNPAQQPQDATPATAARGRGQRAATCGHVRPRAATAKATAGKHSKRQKYAGRPDGHKDHSLPRPHTVTPPGRTTRKTTATADDKDHSKAAGTRAHARRPTTPGPHSKRPSGTDRRAGAAACRSTRSDRTGRTTHPQTRPDGTGTQARGLRACGLRGRGAAQHDAWPGRTGSPGRDRHHSLPQTGGTGPARPDEGRTAKHKPQDRRRRPRTQEAARGRGQARQPGSPQPAANTQ
jgi:hypothetical protein